MASERSWVRTAFIIILSVSVLLWVKARGEYPSPLWAREGIPGEKQKGPTEEPSGRELRKEAAMEERDKLTEEEGTYLLSVARKTIENKILGRGEEKTQQASEVSSRFDQRRGTFVTLTIGGALRGCIGHIIPQESLLEGVRVNAINAAFRDPRFRPLNQKEWEAVKIEVSILTDPRPVAYSDAEDLLKKLRPGIDGLIIKKGHRQATFLPQVWDQLPDKKEFLTHLCLKAGLDGRAWEKEKMEVLTYQVQAFHEK